MRTTAWPLALYNVWRSKPTATTLPIGMIVTGVLAIILGEHSSKAFANLGGATLVRVMGTCLVLGGLAVVAGILREDPALEPMGLLLGALGTAVYGCVAILGLGSQGLITGIDHLLIAIGFLGRIALLLARAPKAGAMPQHE